MVKSLSMGHLRTTKQHMRWWARRQINWKTDYLDTWKHPHRELTLEILRKMKFGSLLEIGCASGPNLARIKNEFPKVELGGVDVSADAIEVAKKHIPNTILDVTPAHDVFMSDKSCDVVLSDMTCIYLGPRMIKKTLKEIERICRKHIILVEFHSDNWFKRMGLRLTTGYYAYNYDKLLDKMGWYDIRKFKIPEAAWPGGEPQKTFGYIIIANTDV